MTVTPGTDATTETDSTTEAEQTTTDDQPKGNREAKYRVERNQAREALTVAEARIQAFQTREVQRLAAELAQPSDLFGVGGVGLADVLTEDGEVDPELVEEAVASLLEQRPGLAKNPRVGAYDRTQAIGNGGRGKPPLDWNTLLDRSN